MWEWFERYWSSVGLGAAVVLLLVLLCTNTFRSQAGVSRWCDPVWIARLMVVAYLLHNFEECGVDAKGRAFHFPVAVNIPFVWIALSVAALWCRRNPAVGLTGAGLLTSYLSIPRQLPCVNDECRQLQRRRHSATA